MPQGKGTYGSKVGRPSKKKKYQAGGPVPGNDEAVLEAAQMGQELKSIPLEGIEPDYPISNAMERSETYQLGGAVKPPTAPSISAYKEGGKVNITDIVKKTESLKKKTKEYDKKIAKSESRGEGRSWESGSPASYMSRDQYYNEVIAKGQIKGMTKSILKGKKKKGKKK